MVIRNNDSYNGSELCNSQDIQNAYVDLYKEMRRYIWGFDAVDALADLEVATYRRCPDLDDIRTKYNRLEYIVRPIRREDEAIDKAFSEFIDTVNSGSSFYSVLTKVNEVVI